MPAADTRKQKVKKTEKARVFEEDTDSDGVASVLQGRAGLKSLGLGSVSPARDMTPEAGFKFCMSTFRLVGMRGRWQTSQITEIGGKASQIDPY